MSANTISSPLGNLQTSETPRIDLNEVKGQKKLKMKRKETATYGKAVGDRYLVENRSSSSIAPEKNQRPSPRIRLGKMP